MKYGRHQIDKAGEIAISSSDTDAVKDAITKINDWRSLHLLVLDKLQEGINTILGLNRIKATFTSRRLKRLTSILYKLDLNSKMKLGGMQDIGGLRVVLPNIQTLDKLYSLLEINIPKGFILDKPPINYIESPKKVVIEVYISSINIFLTIMTIMDYVWNYKFVPNYNIFGQWLLRQLVW